MTDQPNTVVNLSPDSPDRYDRILHTVGSVFDSLGTWPDHPRALETLADAMEQLIDTETQPSQPVEHCGNQLPPLAEGESVTECILRLGHPGSHANDTGDRWFDRAAAGYCPHCGRGDAGPTADDYEASQRRAIRIQTLLDDTRDRVRKLAAEWRQTGTQAGAVIAFDDAAEALTIALEPPKET